MSYELISEHNNELTRLVRTKCRKNGIVCDNDELFEYMHTFTDKSAGEQLSLF